jgi:hypothetical protein
LTVGHSLQVKGSEGRSQDGQLTAGLLFLLSSPSDQNMKSGDFHISRDDAYHREEFAKISDPNFVCETFTNHAALVGKQLVSGHRYTKDYHGEPYDRDAFDLVEGLWDHYHCSVCFFSIRTGHTYWVNGKRIVILCDACYEAFKNRTEVKPKSGNSPR